MFIFKNVVLFSIHVISKQIYRKFCLNVFKHPVRNQTPLAKLIILWHYNECTYAKYYPVTLYVLYKSC